MSQVPAAEELEYDELDADETSYRTLSGMAVLGLVLGVAAAASFEHPVFLLSAVLGAFFSAVALRRISVAMPPPLGRTLALAGLALSIAFGTGTVTGIVYRGAVLNREAHQVAGEFFQRLIAGEVHRAHQLTLAAENRQPENADLWKYYNEDDKAQESLRSFVRLPTVRALSALRDRAQLRHYQTEVQEAGENVDAITEVYAVTYDRRGEKRTFFVSMKLIHERSEVTSRYGWNVRDPLAGMQPKGWQME